jgi:hypothetical protein
MPAFAPSQHEDLYIEEEELWNLIKADDLLSEPAHLETELLTLGSALSQRLATRQQFLDTSSIRLRWLVQHLGYFRQTRNGALVFQLKGSRPSEEYKSLQGAARHTFGALLKININAQLTASLLLELDSAQSSVEMYIAENLFDRLVFAVHADIFDAATGDLTLNLTATAESYMQLATAIRERQQKTVKHGSVDFNLNFGAAGVMQFRSSFVWKSLATCKKLPAGEYALTLA